MCTEQNSTEVSRDGAFLFGIHGYGRFSPSDLELGNLRFICFFAVVNFATNLLINLSSSKINAKDISC